MINILENCRDIIDAIPAELQQQIIAELAKPQTKRLSEERIKELVVARFDYGSAALSELVKAVEQEVLNINGLGEQKPLSDLEISKHIFLPIHNLGTALAFARSIERAHGIGVNK